uniref:Glycoprotein-N-acetylgalactosamine 3-beta-galactosyltransferase 1 n=1 Tax=Panagrellus redivivus TaxID=6233 RepID=A0A7E4VSA9_PANRE
MWLRINQNCLFFVLGLAVASTFFLILFSNNIGFHGSEILKADTLPKQPVLLKQDPEVFDETDDKITELLTDPPEDDNDEDEYAGEDGIDYVDEEAHAMFKHTHENPVASALKDTVRVFCWIMTSPKNIKSRAIHVNATWAPRCNKYVFVVSNSTNSTDYDLPIVELEIPDGRNSLWGKTKAAHQYIYDNELDNYDWFLKADDDTYVIMENLRFMLLAHEPSNPIYFGCKFKPFTKQGYMSGGSGYVLSREAVKLFVEDGLTNPKYCTKQNGGNEDVEIGKCLEKVNVTAGDSRDAKGRHRMLPFRPELHISGGNGTMPKWFYQYIYYPYHDGTECCSDYAISWHYVNREWMHTLDNMFYHIKPVGTIDDGFWTQKAFTDNTREDLIDKLKVFSKNMSPAN